MNQIINSSLDSLIDSLELLPDKTYSFDKYLGELKAQFQAIEKQLSGTRVIEEPTPHVYLENVFDNDFYRRLLGTVDALKPIYIDLRARLNWAGEGEHYACLPAHLQNEVQTGHTVRSRLHALTMNLVLHTVSESINERLLEMFAAWVPEAGLGSTDALDNQAYLMRDEAGYGIEPHTESFHTVITAMFYLPPDNAMQKCGTTLLTPKAPGMKCFGDGEKLPLYPENDFNVSKLLPFKRNSMMAFVKTPYSWHSLPSIGTIPYSRNSLTLNIMNEKRRSDPFLANLLMSGSCLAKGWS